MQIRYITITGVDKKTDIDSMFELSGYCPKVEWGFLYSPSRAGHEPRYMRWDDVLDIAFELSFEGINTSLHLCGRGVDEFIAGELGLSNFNRVQLNFNAARGLRFPLCDLADAIKDYEGKQFIIQHNDNNQHVWKSLLDLPNLALLCDSSGGRGIEISHFPSPCAGVFTGYAGGIGPDNITEIKKDLAMLGDGVCWIDMESNVRTNDWLDLDKVKKVLT